MENPIPISKLNDFVFCPASIYFHNLYNDLEKTVYESDYQTNGTHIHESVDMGTYSTSPNKVLQSTDIYCEQYGLYGKIDVFDKEKGVLTERKKKITTIYDGYVFQLYAQCFALREMGYTVKTLRLYSYDDNKMYNVLLPENNDIMFQNFLDLIYEIKEFNLNNFSQNNPQKCQNCIYEPYCDRSVGE